MNDTGQPDTCVPNIELLAKEQSEWSQKTFGTDEQKGPIGALKHIIKEAQEAIENPDGVEEYADLLLLVLDASRRAEHDVRALIRAAIDKLSILKTRQYPPFDPAKVDEAVEHVRERRLVETYYALINPNTGKFCGDGGSEYRAFDKAHLPSPNDPPFWPGAPSPWRQICEYNNCVPRVGKVEVYEVRDGSQ